MESASQAISKLQDRKVAVEEELASIDVTLRAIRKVLGIANAGEAAAPKKSRAEPAPVEGVAANTRRRRQWFERGEVAALIKKYLKTPLSQAEIVRALAKTKSLRQQPERARRQAIHGCGVCGDRERGESRAREAATGRAGSSSLMGARTRAPDVSALRVACFDLCSRHLSMTRRHAPSSTSMSGLHYTTTITLSTPASILTFSSVRPGTLPSRRPCRRWPATSTGTARRYRRWSNSHARTRCWARSTLNIRGNSYRLNEKLKAGLVRTEDAEA
jgi:hypothetical protein